MFNYKWTLKDAVFTKDKGKVFSSFSCGGGSTMGYKLAGFDVIGCNEIDPKMMDVYITNHNPKISFLEPIQQFKLRDTKENLLKTYGSEENIMMMGGWEKMLMPEELYDLDIYDGSPPCSSFSMAGSREKDWGKEKKFREGQADQILDTLFFDFIEVAKKLQPKIVVAENVKGLMMGEAIKYVREIYDAFGSAGYNVQHWMLDASKMGVPQKRERVFFIALRNDLCEQFLYQKDFFTQAPFLELDFKMKPIKFGEVRSEVGRDLSHRERGKLLQHRIPSDDCIADINMRLYNKNSGFNGMIRHDDKVCGTITSGETDWRYFDGMSCSDYDYTICGSFPLDYNFKTDAIDGPKYLIGMSVPPVMTAQIANQIYLQWLSKLK